MAEERKNRNRGYQKLRVWQDAQELYVLTWDAFKTFPYELKRTVSQQIASVDSIHRNIAEGYCRRGIKEYLYHLNVALGSLGESVSALATYHRAGHLTPETFEKMDSLAFKLENGLIKLVEKLEEKQQDGSWIDHLMIKESDDLYKIEPT
ncbi:MAG: four helix bundle protein [Pontiellaceae bacterium]|nr:four helix bundle protein [Pontiellaceae bacterium]